MILLGRSFRILRTQPGFTAIIVLALGLGIGANCALFTVVNSLLLRPLPYQNAHELVEITSPPRVFPLNELKAAASWSGVAAFMSRGFTVTGQDSIKNVYGFRVSANLFHVLGVRAAVGRIFQSGETDQPVALLGYDYWRRTGGDPQIIGQALDIGGESRTIIGVLPADFTLQVRDGNIFIPYRLEEGRIVARLNAGILPAQAEAEVTAILDAINPPSRRPGNARPQVTPLREAFRSSDGATVWLLQAAVALVLLITCANVGNLLLVRSSARRREFAIRTAIGAGRRQLFSQLMMENLLLAFMGGAVGLLFANWSLSFVGAQLPANIARRLQGAEALSMDLRVLAFAAGLSLLTLLLFGLAPAVDSLRFDLVNSLRDASKGGTPRRQRFGQTLVIAEVALALMLLISAGLMLKSLLGLQRQNLGFSPENVLQAFIYAPTPGGTSLAYIAERIQALPGVETMGVVGPQLYPFGGPRVLGSVFEIRGSSETDPRAETYYASPDYFRSVQIPLLKGRVFTAADTKDAAPVAIVSSIVAHRYWGDRDPIGQMIRLSPADPDAPWLTIVGVVGDVRNPVGLDVQPTAYRPIAQTDAGSVTLMIRTSLDSSLLAEAVRLELRRALPNAPEVRLNNLEIAVRNYISPQRFTTTVIGIFAILGLVLASVGVYGVMRYWVTVRIPEIGIRIALGAKRSDVVLLVLKRAATASAAGVAAGIIGAIALRKVIASQLYGVSPTDPEVVIAVSAFLGAIAITAALVPAISATRIDPISALRHE